MTTNERHLTAVPAKIRHQPILPTGEYLGRRTVTGPIEIVPKALSGCYETAEDAASVVAMYLASRG